MKKSRNEYNLELIDKKDFDKLLSENYRYIIQCANKYNNAAYQKDLEAVGKIGFWRAYNDFDKTRGIPFIYFASSYIRNEMLNFLRDETRVIKTPHNCQKAYGIYMQLENPTEEDLKQFTKKQLDFIYSAEFLKTKSLDEPAYDDSNTSLSETVASVEAPEPDDRLEPLYASLDKLPPDLKEILIQYYGLFNTEPMTLKEIAEQNKFTYQYMQMKLKKAEKYLRHQTQIKKP